MITARSQNAVWEERLQEEFIPGRNFGAGTGERRRAPSLRYAGFDHLANIRSYLFQSVAAEDDGTLITVKAEMSLFARHHVSIQDGPAVCLGTLKKMDPQGLLAAVSLPHMLTDADMLAHLAALPVPSKKSHGKSKAAAVGHGEVVTDEVSGK